METLIDVVTGKALAAVAVHEFRANEAYYLTPEFDETATRQLFIDRLFQALGWDVTGAGGADRDVVFHPRRTVAHQAAGNAAWDEDLTEAELAARAPTIEVPDYSFRINGRPVFLLEAKRPHSGIAGRGPAYQLKTYAWSQRLRISVLTDFKTLRIYDTSTRPERTDPRGGLVLELTYDQYEAQWDRLWSLLSREAHAAAINAGATAPTTLPAVRRGAIQVDEAFLRELEEWRGRLAQDLFDRNADLLGWQIAEATQRILDRLVFLRVVEDRSVHPHVLLRRYARLTDAYRHLTMEFRHLDAIYNGQLFAPHASEDMEVSDGVLQPIVARLYTGPYRFDTFSADFFGSVYERFLGKEVVVSGATAEVIDKPEVRHAGGVYYTPRWVVDAIVDHTLSQALAARTARKRTPVAPSDVRQLRVLDPACGSGTFLLGALDWMINWCEEYYTANPEVEPLRHHADPAGRRRLTTDAKSDLALTCLYGVDLDPAAVEVAQMSIYLRILEAETAASLSTEDRLFHGAVLPSLSRNVRAGNSLLTRDQVPDEQLFDLDLLRRINPFDWTHRSRGFGEVLAAGGFDAAIGNPPYTRVQVLRQTRPEETSAYERHYDTATGGFDSATLFVEKALTLLRAPGTYGRADKGGRLGFITSRQFIETDAGASLRERLARGQHVDRIVDFGSGLVFATASAYTLMLFLTRGRSNTWTLTRVPSPPTEPALEAAAADPVLTVTQPSSVLGPDIWTLSLPAETSLLQRLESSFHALGAVSGDSIFQAPVTGADYVFRGVDLGPDPDQPHLRLWRPNLLPAQATPRTIEAELLRPVIAGRSDMRRFYVRDGNDVLLLPYAATGAGTYELIPFSQLAAQAPHAAAWLEENREQLTGRSGRWTPENWHKFSRRQNLEKFSAPKIMVPSMVDHLCATFDDRQRFFVNVSTGGYGIGMADGLGLQWEFVAALLNSRLLTWVLRRYSRAWRGGWFEARKANLERLPIAMPSPDVQENVTALYRRCVQATAQMLDGAGELDAQRVELLQGNVEAVAAAFDAEVARLYGLSSSEQTLIAD